MQKTNGQKIIFKGKNIHFWKHEYNGYNYSCTDQRKEQEDTNLTIWD